MREKITKNGRAIKVLISIVVFGILVVAGFTTQWNQIGTNVEDITENREEIAEVKETVEENEKRLIGIGKDIEYIREGIDEIKKRR